MRTSRRIAAAALALVLGIGALVGVTPAPAGAGVVANCSSSGTLAIGPVHNYLCVQNGAHVVVYRYRKDGTQIGVATDAHLRSEVGGNIFFSVPQGRVQLHFCANPDVHASTAGAPAGYSYSFAMPSNTYPFVTYAGALNVAADGWSYLDLYDSTWCGSGGFHQDLY